MQTEFESQSVTPNILKWKVHPWLYGCYCTGETKWMMQQLLYLLFFYAKEATKKEGKEKRKDPTDIKHRLLGLREAFNGKRIKTTKWIVSAGQSWSRPLTRFRDDFQTRRKKKKKEKERWLSTVFNRNRSGISDIQKRKKK